MLQFLLSGREIVKGIRWMLADLVCLCDDPVQPDPLYCPTHKHLYWPEMDSYMIGDLTQNHISWGPMSEEEADAFIARHNGTLREGAYYKMTSEQWEASRKAGQVR